MFVYLFDHAPIFLLCSMIESCVFYFLILIDPFFPTPSRVHFFPSSFISFYIQWKINKYVLTCWNNSFLSLLLSTFTLSFPKAFCWSTFIPFIRCAHVPIVQRFTYWFDRISQWKIFLKHTVLMMIRDVTQYVSACCCLTLAVFTVIWLGAMGLSPSLISPPRP